MKWFNDILLLEKNDYQKGCLYQEGRTWEPCEAMGSIQSVHVENSIIAIEDHINIEKTFDHSNNIHPFDKEYYWWTSNNSERKYDLEGETANCSDHYVNWIEIEEKINQIKNNQSTSG